MKSKLLLISPPNSYRIAPYLKAATQMGLEVVIASEGKHSLISEVHAGIHIEDLNDLSPAITLLLAEAEKRPFAGVLGSDDRTVELAATVARTLGLPHNPPEAARISRRKDIARAHLALSGCAVPAYCLISLNRPLEHQMKNLPWPCVIKPLALSASCGVIRANDENEFVAACQRVKTILEDVKDEYERNHVLVEQYIDGVEVAYEGYLKKGQLHTLAVFDKPDPMEGPFFEETIYVTPSRLENDQLDRIKSSVQQACDAYGLTTGPVHAELRLNIDGAWILEVASRTIGGDCARALDTTEGLNLESVTIALATGKDFEFKKPDTSRGVMMIPIEKSGILRRVEGLLTARKTPNVDAIHINISEGHELVPLPEGSQYAGHIFASAETPEAVITALRLAHSRIKLVAAPLLLKTRALV